MSAQSATPIASLTASQKIQLNKLEKRLRRHVGQAIAQYNMIEDGDKIMVCVSGGKDSYALLAILMLLKESAPIHFDIVAVNLDQKQPGFPEHILPAYLESLGVEYKIAQEDTYSIVKDKIPEGKTTCSLCSRLRRAILYKVAAEIGATKIALGHHRDDMVETLMLNMFYGGKLKSMPAKLVSDNGEHVVIRPLAFCKEAELIQYAQLKAFPIIPCNLCGSQPNLQRQNIKKMLQDWNVNHPGRIESMFTAIRNVVPSHLCDSELFDFKSINAQSGVINGGDIAFDDELIVAPVLDDNISIEHNSKNNLSFNNALNIIEIK
ncbi:MULTISPECIES: tRNA 2-thiocytidine(32) synthetase TtcA [unclassified Colwellia]|uniref:tRNA 2-thiocytidine(32) synthetase TtcA n=1 Tax=unclassified Colwellia TaxID=196834 RepID=UPI0015F471AD|nr:MULTISPECIES: tRNA 2-thiocytidine(32) synthetase TtcA [unclassified Colwellia]MBA6233914.1 tRNA 2-thiocytidine(32) synthetase TtcA [Colwellia sp. MB02u-7]MBA6237612.1 tRNA 2-thiocytidine(32) synthetase TtcA [Colwellia sp. MB02u-11]MBA6256053.1 tRNA 2-thiocytidine(32) synthetase TtcA [Colwellia sp. MB3u-28]MBA6259974.1 tRNA 2-thiocytidine(32) synthetase TtcA [Colwellia sp. MB3u-41]MBA6300587.1 tRNA 2-thiocytidine(32) synthetase TtcA [Colwellia sp. MB3u-22]